MSGGKPQRAARLRMFVVPRKKSLCDQALDVVGQDLSTRI
jgi:hypothetical protein